MKTNHRILGLALAVLPLAACGSGEDGGPSDSSSGNLSIKLVGATQQATARGKARVAGSACTLQGISGGDSVTGTCFTPINVRGSFTKANLSRAAGGIGARILGGGSESGFESVFKRGLFDIASSPSIASSEDNLQDALAGTTYDIFSVSAQVVETTIAAGNPSKYYHIRTYFVGQPPSTDPGFGSCTFSTSEQEIMDENGTIYTGSNSGIQAKDILVCIKSSDAETCAESDYQWVSSAGALSATRPTTPKQLTTNDRYFTASTCTMGSDHPDMTWGYGEFAFDLGTEFSVTAAIDQGVKTYTYGGTSGTAIEFEVSMNMTGSMFFKDGLGLNTDPANWTESQLLNNIEYIQLKPIAWAASLGTSPADGMLGGAIDATMSVTVSD